MRATAINKRNIPTNAVTGKEYTGINACLLNQRHFRSNQWMTLEQIQSFAGSWILYTEKPTAIYYKSIDPQHPDRKVPCLKRLMVWNVDQVAGLPDKYSGLEEQISQMLDSSVKQAA